jgi:D-alanyl-D-alanine carboxypeptidase
MCRIRAIIILAVLPFLASAGRAQTIPDQIDAILARTAVAGNTWTVLVENTDGSVIYYQRNPTTGQAPARA